MDYGYFVLDFLPATIFAAVTWGTRSSARAEQPFPSERVPAVPDETRFGCQLELLLRAVRGHVWDAADLRKLYYCIKGIGTGARQQDRGDRGFSAQEYLSPSESERLIFYTALVETLRQCRPASAAQLNAAHSFLQSRLDWRIPDKEQEETRNRITALADGAVRKLA